MLCMDSANKMCSLGSHVSVPHLYLHPGKLLLLLIQTSGQILFTHVQVI